MTHLEQMHRICSEQEEMRKKDRFGETAKLPGEKRGGPEIRYHWRD